MACFERDVLTITVVIDEIWLELVNEFVQLGSLITTDNNNGCKIRRCIAVQNIVVSESFLWFK